MLIGFYAPLKPPDHPVPSGDRLMARLLIAALEMAGHEVKLMSRFRSWDGTGDRVRQARLAAIGRRQPDRLLARCVPSPDLWFTYHLHHKAPDLIGPKVARRLGIPYVVAEASFALKQANGPWAAGHAAVADALGQAAAVIGLNPADEAGVRLVSAPAACHVALSPFLDLAPFGRARAARAATRAALIREHGLDPDWPWLVVVAMMRPGDKLASYRLLGEVLTGILDRPWHLMVVGDGPERAAVAALLAPLAPRVRLFGRRAPEEVAPLLAAADLAVWPAIGEAWGMALLEAQAAGLPLVAGRAGGVASIMVEGETGLLAREGDAAGLAAALAALLDDPIRRQQMGRAAVGYVSEHHGLATAARRLDAALSGLL